MTQNQSYLASFIFWMLCFIVSGYFIIHGLGFESEKGYLSFLKLDQDIATAQAELDDLRSYRDWLEHRISLVAEGDVDADFLSELARDKGGLFASDELIFDFN